MEILVLTLIGSYVIGGIEGLAILMGAVTIWLSLKLAQR